jgi:GNAT superfamily N-acetyltransferase
VTAITDQTQIRAVLETDRSWAVYALGDLSPGFFEHCEWRCTPDALLLLYRAFEIPVLFTLGSPADIRSLLDTIDEERLYLSIHPDVLPLVKARYTVHDESPMWRMILDPAEYRPLHPEGTVRLGPSDLEPLQRLYADGQASGEVPDFFRHPMLEQGVYFGCWEGGELTSAAGTHLVAPEEGVAAIGNVYTRRDRRGRGLGEQVTGAVVAELLGMGLRTIALNVAQKNAPAVRVYERLGFARYCPFYEGLAVRE